MGMILWDWKDCGVHVPNDMQDWHEAQNAMLVTRRDKRLDIEPGASFQQM